MAVMKMETGAKDKLTDVNSTLADAVRRGVAQQEQPVQGLGSIKDIRKEIDDVLADMRMFYKAEPDMVMQAVSAHSARLVEIIILIQRIEVMRREWKAVREEADRVLLELKSQFAVASRVVAMRQQDWEFSARGQL